MKTSFNVKIREYLLNAKGYRIQNEGRIPKNFWSLIDELLHGRRERKI